MNRRHMKVALPILALLLIFCTPALRSAADQTYEDMKMLVEVMNLIKDNYVQEIDTKKLMYGAAAGMVRVARWPSWWQPMQLRFLIAVSQSLWVIFSGMSLLPPNWVASGIFSIEYQ